VTVGSTVQLAYSDQDRTLTGTHSLIEEIGGGAEEVQIGKQAIPSASTWAQFGFRGASQQKTAGELSGGERNRAPPRQDPQVGRQRPAYGRATNDLDVNTLRMLEEAIMQFSAACW